MILIADQILDGGVDQEGFGGIDAQVRRNAFGRQVDSFETDLTFAGISGAAFRAVFIRAPWVESVGTQVEVLASFNGHPVAIRQGHLLATSFHPELTGDNRIHRFFVDQLCKESSKAGI
jgi:5'-phosphate synthase pdxT subunit